MAPRLRSAPNLRRSSRVKRLASDALQQSPSKRPKQDPKPSNQSGFDHSSSLRTNPTEQTYPQCSETLFLSDDFETLHWLPAQTKASKHRKPLTLLREYDMNTQEYFASVRAGTHAASSKMFMFRHVGSIFLKGFEKNKGKNANRYFQSILASEDSLVNLNRALNGATISDPDLLETLLSLTRSSENLWTGPFIVLVANREDVTKACNAKKRTPAGITAQVYIGRLLFELIACHDIKVLFEALHPSVPHTPVPSLSEHQKVFSRSKENSQTSKVSFSTILRNAESLGYPDLTGEQMKKITQVLNVKLFPFQEQTVRWMLDMENGPYSLNDFFWEERYFTGPKDGAGGPFYYFPLTGELRLRKPPQLRGGMITEEMGLGKTIEALALIAAQSTEHKPYEVNVWCESNPADVVVRNGIISMKRARQKNSERSAGSSGFRHGDEVLNDYPNKDFPKNVKVRRWPAKTTLVVCPRSLIGQWKQEAEKRAPSLSVELWESDADKECRESQRTKTELGRESIAVGENAKDVIISGYEALRKDHVLSQIFWRRLILDEAQMTRRSTAQIAQDVFNLRTSSRFLMTGTPIVNSINDLKGELAMLKVWPFTLENDGFWEQHIQGPFNRRRKIPLLDQLLKVTMMRHTKGQDLGITLPPRIYKTMEVDLVGSHRATYCYVLGSCLDELEAQDSEDIDTRRVRIFLRLMVSICLSPEILDLSSLDLARRFTWSRRPSAYASSQPIQTGDQPGILKLTPVEAIEFVAESAERVVRYTGRSFATGHANISNELDRFLRMPLEELRKQVLSKELVARSRISKLRRERLAALAAGGVHRLTTDTLVELRATAIEVGIVEQEEAKKLSRATAIAKLQQHYDMLNGIERTRSVHESGFLAITKIMEHKGNPSCPVCLTECDDRIAVTKCGHIYCFDCVMLMLESSSSFARCAICRRDVTAENVIELERPKKISETKEVKREPVVAKIEAKMASVSQLGGESGQAGGKPVKQEPETVTAEEASKDEASCLSDEKVEISKPTARDAWSEYEQLGDAPSRFQGLGRNAGLPSLDATFLRHLAAVRGGLESPKLSALHSLIQSTPEDTKFCVVAASIHALREIHIYLSEKGISCVGAGVHSNTGGVSRDASAEFSENPDVRVFLLNPANSSGLTLIAAEYVIFMETLVRIADEVQAAARVHRIGQSKPVKIIRMVARNTIEELIIQQRGEIRGAEEESEVLSAVNSRDASDMFILDLLRDEK